jgi:two-component system nitrate/nitrite response regulator NarL
LLASGHSLFRESVKMVLSAEGNFRVVAEASEGLHAVAETERTRPDVALLDCNLANCDSTRATDLITKGFPECRVIILADDDDQSTLFWAVEAGASGYLTKNCPMSELIAAIRAVSQGSTVIPARMLGHLLGDLMRRRREQDEALRKISLLTMREREVLTLLASGGDNDAIARALVISPQTARTHIQNILTKLNVHSRLQAAALVIQSGMDEHRAGAKL